MSEKKKAMYKFSLGSIAALALAAIIDCSFYSRIIPHERRELCFEIERKATPFSICTPHITLNDLEHIADVKEFAQQEFGLYKTSNYITFKDPPRTLYSLIVTSTASPPSSPFTFRRHDSEVNYCEQPVLPLRIQSEIDTLDDEKECFEKKGYDVFLGKITNLEDGSNINKEFTNNPLIRRTELICHEDFHQTDKKKGNNGMPINLQESRAQWVGLVCAIEYFRQRGDVENHQKAQLSYDYWLGLAKKVNEAVEQLDLLYEQKSSYSGEQLKEKEKQILDKVISGFNKSELMGKHPYSKYLPLLDERYIQINHNYQRMMEIIFNTPIQEEKAQNYFRTVKE